MTTALAIFQASIEGLEPESIPFTTQWTLPTAVLKDETLAWGPGDQTLTVPTGCTLIVLIPAVTTTAVLKVGGTTGWAIASTVPTVMTNGSTGSRVINASLAVTGFRVRYM